MRDGATNACAMIRVRAWTRSPPSRATSCAAGSMRATERVTRSPRRAAAPAAARGGSSSPETPLGKPRCSRSARTPACPPGARARRRSCAALRCAVDRGGKPGGAATDDRDVYSSELALVWRPRRLARSRTSGRTISCPSASRSAGSVGWAAAGPDRRQLGRIGHEPAEGDLVRARKRRRSPTRRPALADDRTPAARAARRRCFAARRCARRASARDPQRDLRRHRRDGVVLLHVDAHHA